MTKNEIVNVYLNWAANHMVYATPRDIDNAVSLSEFDGAASEQSLSGTSVLAVTKHHREKIHIFIFTHKATWLCDDIGDMVDNRFIKEEYDLIATI